MKVLFYLHRFSGLGGIETVTRNLANYLAGKGNAITICEYIKDPHIDLTTSLHEQIRVITLSNGEQINHPSNREELRSLFLSSSFDVVVFQDSYAPIEKNLYRVLRQCPAPLITVEQNKPVWKDIPRKTGDSERISVTKVRSVLGAFRYNQWVRPRRQHRLFKKSDRYVLLSAHYADEFLKLSKIKHPRGKLVFQAHPLQFDRGEDSIPAKEKVFLFVGSINYRKGVDRLISIWKRTAGQVPDWTLRIIGDGPLLHKMKTTVNEDQIPRVEFLGAQADLKPFYSTAPIILMVSDYEGFPMVLPESMQYGCVPIVYNSFQAIYDVVTDGVNGLIIPAFDEGAFCDRLVKLATSPEMLKPMQKAALKDARRFSMQTIGPRWVQLIHEVRDEFLEME